MYKGVFNHKEGVAYNDYLVVVPGERCIELLRTPFIDSNAVKVSKSDLLSMKKKFEQAGWKVINNCKM